MAGLCGIQGGSFEAGWQSSDVSVLVERVEKVHSHRSRNIARVEASRWQSSQISILVELIEEIVSR